MNCRIIAVTLSLLFFTKVVNSEVRIVPHSKTFDLKHNLNLECNVTTDEKINGVKWEKDGALIQEIDSMKERITTTIKKGSIYNLKIEKATEDDAGNYSCIVYRDDIEIKRASLVAATTLKVKITPDDMSVVEGEKLRIHCNVQGIPPPELKWFAVNETVEENTDRIKLFNDTEKNVEKAIFVIDDVQLSDRGVYKCIGYSKLLNKTVEAQVMVRIKDKYAALWPFLGICAEVFILCAIILIYEKKRNKTELEESDTDQSPDQKNTPDHGKESNLRHRQ